MKHILQRYHDASRNTSVFCFLAFLQLSLTMAFGLYAPVDNTSATISDGYVFFKDRPDTTKDDYLTEDQDLVDARSRTARTGESFATSPYYGDQIFYMRMALGQEVMPPYRYRIVAPFLAGLLVKGLTFFNQLFGDGAYQPGSGYRLAGLAFMALNFVALLAGTYVLWLTLGVFTTNLAIRAIGSMLFLSQYSVINTASFAMVDVVGFLAFNLTLYCLVTRKLRILPIFLILSVLTKDVFVIWTPALLLYFWDTKDRRYLLYSLIPIATFCTMRLLSGDDPLSVNYGWKVSQGQFGTGYLRLHLGSIQGIAREILALLTSFGVLWFYIPKFGKLREIKMFHFGLGFTVLIIAAQIMLSSSIVRTVAPVVPLFIILAAIMQEGASGNRHLGAP